MKLLLFATPAFYRNKKRTGTRYNGGGWMFSLQEELLKCEDLELAICFQNSDSTYWEKEVQDGVTYYSFTGHKKKFFDKIKDIVNYKDECRDSLCWSHYTNIFKDIIEDYRPDIIHVFGSETYNQLVPLCSSNFPLVLHIQGILSLYKYSYLIPCISKKTFIFSDFYPKNIFRRLQETIYWNRDVYREKKILQSTKYVIGRTNWDKKAIEIINSKAKYFYGGEMLRNEFYGDSKRMLPQKFTIVTTSSNKLYKGYDVILKIASILKHESHVEFIWNVYGNINPNFIEKNIGLKHEDVNVNLCGIASACELRDAILHSSVYLQPSYIENSPNSISEAQILGVPVIATNVGGTESLVKHGETGFLFPVTDPYMAVWAIVKLANDVDLNVKIGKNAQVIAQKRHNREDIMKSLIETYKIIINDNK